jgi:hypothetical protein
MLLFPQTCKMEPNHSLSIDFALEPKRDGESLDSRGWISFKLCDWRKGNYIVNMLASYCVIIYMELFCLVWSFMETLVWCMELAACCSCFREKFSPTVGGTGTCLWARMTVISSFLQNLHRRREPRKRYLCYCNIQQAHCNVFTQDMVFMLWHFDTCLSSTSTASKHHLHVSLSRSNATATIEYLIKPQLVLKCKREEGKEPLVLQ